MQNVRWNLTDCALLETPPSAAVPAAVVSGQLLSLNATHTDSSGQLLGSQLKMVQYPPGCVVSQSRSPLAEQSVEMEQWSPIFGAHPARKQNETTTSQAHRGTIRAEAALTGRHPTLGRVHSQAARIALPHFLWSAMAGRRSSIALDSLRR
jgi:hypothetical protein